MYKLENGILIKAPKSVHRQIDGVEFITSNPTDEILAGLGYKHLKEQEKPEITKYQLITEVLDDSGATIVRRWEVTDKPIINDPLPEVEKGQEFEDYEDYEYVTATEVHRGKRLVAPAEDPMEE